jgi:pristinamycin I synthase 3 and 4
MNVHPLSEGIRPLSLSAVQRGIWAAQMLHPDRPIYNVGEYLEIFGPVDRDLFESALRDVVANADALHLRIVDTGDGPRQFFAAQRAWELPFLDVSRQADPRAAAEAWMRDDMDRVVDVARGPLFGFALFRAADDRYYWYARYHHLCNDGVGLSLIARRVAGRYSALIEGRVAESPNGSWSEVLEAEERYRGSEQHGVDEAFWSERLRDRPEPVTLSGKKPGGSTGGRKRSDWLSRDVASGLRKLAKDEDAKLVHVALAATAVYLHHLTQQRDLVVGMAFAARTEPRLRHIVGMVSKVLPLRLEIDPDAPFGALVQHVKLRAREVQAHQLFSMEDLRRQQDMGPDQHLYGTVVNFMPFDYDLRFGGHAARAINIGNFLVDDFQLAFYDRGDDIRIDFLANPGHYDDELLAAHQQRIRAFLARLPHAHHTPVRGIDVLEPRERDWLIHDLNATHRDIPDASLGALFDERAARDRDAIAIVDGGTSIAYGDLAARADRLARQLRARGVREGDLVAIRMERNAELVIAMLAIVKAGAAYVPLDLAYPAERIEFLMRDSGAQFVLTEIPAEDAPDVTLPQTSAGSLAYVMYTSGSTGIPKGSAVPHRAVIRLVRNTDYVSLGAGDRIAQLANTSFDAATFEMWGALLNGATLVILPRETILSPAALAGALAAERIDTIFLTTALFNQIARELPDAFRSLRDLLFGGEAVDPHAVRQVLAHGAPRRLLHVYGPTENTTFSTWQLVEAVEHDASTVPIGLPLANSTAHILDARLEPVPAGITGELCLGGIGLAWGYHGRAAMTAERFVADPYASAPGARMYRTGDLVRRDLDGAIEFVGRADHQVKLRGFRIEPGEIEEALRKHERVRDALVTVHQSQPDRKELLAYVIDRDAGSASDAPIEQWQELYESTYAAGAEVDPDFNLTGWNSSYTRAPIAADEMRMWVAETLRSLEALHPKRVLEIGCGTGLLLTRLAPQCESYTGLDFSGEVLAQLRRHIAQSDDLRHVVLRQGLAHELSFVADDSVDLVILNSTIQYFPNAGYLLDVLREAVRVTRKGGSVFIGDVRSLPLLRAFHTSVQAHQAAPDTPLAELRHAIDEAERNEEELLVDQALFDQIARRWDKIARAGASLKAGAYDNELTRFRYDVTLHIGEKQTPAPPDRWLTWDDAGVWTIALEDALARQPGLSIGVRGLPDARVAPFIEAVTLLDDVAIANVAQLRDAMTRANAEDPDAVMRVARRLGIDVVWHGFNADGVYDAVFQPRWISGTTGSHPVDLRSLTNIPRQGRRGAQLAVELKAFLQQSLPEYMIPSAVLVLPAWPLTPNGKIDRNALPVPGRAARGTSAYRAPRTPHEKLVSEIFAEVLGIERVGVDDDFFDLGGHSLVATRLASRVRARLNIDLPLREIFRARTVLNVGALVQSAMTDREERTL